MSAIRPGNGEREPGAWMLICEVESERGRDQLLAEDETAPRRRLGHL